jgi:tetratricopeptide (TPR) repeat protein
MKKSVSLILLLAALGVLGFVVVEVSSIYKSRSTEVSGSPEPARLTKTDQRILQGMTAIERAPDKSDGYNQLAAAYMQKARETNDFDLNAQADEAITRSLAVESDNYDALKLLAKLQLTYHRFAEALATARRAQTVRTDDHDVWGQITDALVELGKYPDAVTAAQRMVDLRPESSSYARVSYLRSLHGDIDGAIQAMVLALRTANPSDPEGIAWCRVQLGNELMNAGKLDAAELQFDEALRTFAAYHLALEGKARARIAAGDLHAAVQIYERQQAKEPSADAAQMLGDLYTLLGREEAARNAYEKFEILERENAAVEKSWRHMFNYWLDHDQNVEAALTLATREYEARKDIFTCDSFAWALYKNGRVEEAKKVIDEALRTGSQDARINYHAGIIYKSLNIRDKAARYLRLGAVINSSFDPSQAQNAQQILADLKVK